MPHPAVFHTASQGKPDTFQTQYDVWQYDLSQYDKFSETTQEREKGMALTDFSNSTQLFLAMLLLKGKKQANRHTADTHKLYNAYSFCFLLLETCSAFMNFS